MKHILQKMTRPAQVGQIARRVVDSGRFETYGTPPAREYLRQWADRYGPASKQAKKPKVGENLEEKPDTGEKPDRNER